MRSRGLVVAIAVVLAVLAAVGVIVYTNQVKDEAASVGTTPVIVSVQNIEANTPLDPLIDQGGYFEERLVPEDGVVADAVTSIEELRGQTTAAPIFANEQIPATRLSSGAGAVSFAGVSKGHIGIAMQLEGPRAGNGLVQQGQNVAVFATFDQATPITKQSLQALLGPKQINAFFTAAAQGGVTGLNQVPVFSLPFEITVTLVPAVKVLAIQNPPVDEQGRSSGGSVTLAFDALPDDARDLIFAGENAKLWLGLLPPDNAEGYPGDATIGIPYERIVGELKK
jgi:Flp pilus assembly protein CpaB